MNDNSFLAKPKSFVKRTPIGPIKGSPHGSGGLRTVAAATGIPEVDVILNSKVTKEVINHPVVDRHFDVPYMAGGSIPLNDPTIYVDRHVPKRQVVPSLSNPKKMIIFDPARPWVVHENVEQHVMEILIKRGMKPEEAYRVAHFEFAEKAEQAWYKFHDINAKIAEKEQLSWLPRIQHENPKNPPPNLYKKPYPHANIHGARKQSVHEEKPSRREVKIAYEIIRSVMKKLKSETPNRITETTRDVSRIVDIMSRRLRLEISAIPLPRERPDLEYSLKRSHKRPTKKQSQEVMASAAIGGVGARGGAGGGY